MLIMTQKEYERRVKAALDKRMEEEVKFARMEDDMRQLHRELYDMESRLRKMIDVELSALRRDENHAVCGEALRQSHE